MSDYSRKIKNNRISKFFTFLLLIILLIAGREECSRSEERDVSYYLCKKVSNVELPHGLLWSPDGSEICFRSLGIPVGGKDVYFIRTDTGAIRKIEPLSFLQGTDPNNKVGILMMHWSPNGKEIALMVAGIMVDKAFNDIIIIDSRNLTLPKVYPKTSGVWTSVKLDLWNNCWSPDGKKIAFISSSGRNKCELLVIDSETLKTIQRYEASLPIYFSGWSSDGEEIYFSDDKRNYSMRLGRSGKRTIEHMKVPYDNTISPDGDHMLGVSEDGHSLLTMSIDGFDKRVVFSTRDGTIGGMVGDDLCWSPNGKKVLFTLSFFNDSGPLPQETSSSIWMVNFDGTELLQITSSDVLFARNPRWSPDGEKIAFFAYFDEGKSKNTASASAKLTYEELLKLGEAAYYNYHICIIKCRN